MFSIIILCFSECKCKSRIVSSQKKTIFAENERGNIIFIFSCLGWNKSRYVRVVKETDSKSVGLCLRRFESCCRRFFLSFCIPWFTSFFLRFYFTYGLHANWSFCILKFILIILIILFYANFYFTYDFNYFNYPFLCKFLFYLWFTC